VIFSANSAILDRMGVLLDAARGLDGIYTSIDVLYVDAKTYKEYRGYLKSFTGPKRPMTFKGIPVRLKK
jgi:hypothetical protein